jgi:hypothetical protein
LPEVENVATFGERAHVWLRTAGGGAGDRLAAQLRAAGLENAQVRSVQTSLEDVFINRLAEMPS